MGAGGGGHGDDAGGMGGEVREGGDEGLVWKDVAGLAIERRDGGGAHAGGGVVDNVARAAGGGDEGGDAAGEGFKDDVAEGVGVGGEDEEVHVAVGLGEVVPAEDAGEEGVGESVAELGLEGAVADDEEADVADAELAEAGLDLGEESDVFLDGEAADEAEDEGVGGEVAESEEDGVGGLDRKSVV